MESTEIISKIIGHDFVRLTNRGNSAIQHAIRVARAASDKEYVLIQDQGGWLTYKNYPIKEGFKVKEIKTDYGVIDASMLEKELDNCAALIISQPAGYFAALNLKQIYQKCKDKCLVIADVTGSIGDKELCDGRYADIMLGSFGEWKPVNLGYGGFVSFKNKELFEISQKVHLLEFDENYDSALKEKLKVLDKRYGYLYKTTDTIKHELAEYDVIHKDKKGINVVVKFNDDGEKEKLIEYCNKHELQYTICPRYIRVNENAISIEVKRL
jgi:dTDP-4-amino-4,6-dideoxygalactose transaminase